MPEWTLPLLEAPGWLAGAAAAAAGAGPAAAAVGAAAAAAKAVADAAKAAAAQAVADAKKLQEMKDLLNKSTTGAEAVKYLVDKNVKVEFANGGGSYWDGSKIVIDRNEGAESAALTLVHEVNHTQATLEGTGADIAKDTRGDYVQKMLDEEVRGTVDSIQAKNELVAGGTGVTATFPLESQYNTAYKDAVDDVKKDNPKATEAAQKAAGEKAGYDAVMKGFNDGSVVTSNTHEKYPDYYGNSWDGAHP
jgi:hypothetical protein